MRNHTQILLALFATSGFASLAAADVPCAVTIARAPDDVREAIESWVAAEPACATTLEVRVVPTDGGLYMFARDSAGRIRERIVPDAQSAGVLVASWVADDGVAPREQPTKIEIVIDPNRSPPVPIASPVIIRRDDGGAPRSRVRQKYLAIGGAVEISDGPDYSALGVRAEADVWRGGAWSLSAVLAASTKDEGLVYSTSANETVRVTDLRLLGGLTRVVQLGRFDLRLSFAAGLTRTYLTGAYNGNHVEVEALTPTAEVSLLLAGELSGGWGIVGGPILTYSKQEFITDRMAFVRRDGEVAMFGGIRRSL